MSRIISIVALLLVSTAGPASGIVIEQLTTQLGTTPNNNWNYNPDDGSITIFNPNTTYTYIFWSHANGDPDTLAQIQSIALDDGIDPGTVKVKVSKSAGGLTPGATTIGRIAIEDSGITSILEGISVTGDFLTVDSMTVDQVVGPIEVGGALLNAMTVLEDLEGAVSIADFTTVGADIEIVGDMLATLSIGTYILNRTSASYDNISAVAA